MDIGQNEKSARSARQHKARGVSPGIEWIRITEPAEWATEFMTGGFRKMVDLRYHEWFPKGCRSLRGLVSRIRLFNTISVM